MAVFGGPGTLGNVWKNERGIAPEVSGIRCSPAAAWETEAKALPILISGRRPRGGKDQFSANVINVD